LLLTCPFQLRRYELDNFDCRMLSGHTDVVMAVDVNRTGDVAASCSKDHTARVWRVDTLKSVALCEGHTEAVGALALAKLSNDFLITGSKDKTIKLWDLASVDTASSSTELQPVRARFTQRAHDRDINSIAVAPNDKFFATASQDKTIKLWNTADMTLLATLQGHRRGVWCVEFSPVDQVLVTFTSLREPPILSLTLFRLPQALTKRSSFGQ
jgi:U3 small nucleolar RNA-associated protein 13